MLVLSRRLGEAIRIHDRITVTVLQVSGRRVKLGIDAPASVAIRRRELVEACGGPAGAIPARRPHSPGPPARPCSK